MLLKKDLCWSLRFTKKELKYNLCVSIRKELLGDKINVGDEKNSLCEVFDGES
jgi:hypothetical protein